VIPVKRYRHSGESQAEAGIHVVTSTIWIPAFAGITPEGLLKGFAQIRFNLTNQDILSKFTIDRFTGK
jgi:hypothetical protein